MDRAYSFAALARSVWPSNPDRFWMIAYKAYYDASGRDQTPGRVVVVGVAARVAKWEKFERAWDAALDEFGITFHHHKEYTACTGEFKKWEGNHPDRTRYAAALLQVCKVGIQKSFMVAIEDASVKAVTDQYDGFFKGDGKGAYALAGNAARRSVEEFLIAKKERFSIHHIFEHGDTNQDLLRSLLDEDADQYDGYSVLKKQTKEGRYVRQFEASDFLAWESRRLLQDIDRAATKPRAIAVEIAKHLPIAGIIPTTEQLLAIAEEKAAPFRKRA